MAAEEHEQQQDAEGDHALAHHDFPAPLDGYPFQGIDEQGNVAERIGDEQEQDKSLEEILCHGGVIEVNIAARMGALR